MAENRPVRDCSGLCRVGDARSEQTHDLKQLACANARLARAQATLSRHRAEMIRVQVDGIRARAMQHQVRAVMDWPRENIVVNIPDVQEMLDADTY